MKNLTRIEWNFEDICRLCEIYEKFFIPTLTGAYVSRIEKRALEKLKSCFE